MSDSSKSLLRAAASFFSGTMLSRISGLARDLIMAFAFGTQELLAAFLVAFRLAHLLRRLFAEGALQTAFIPQFEKLRHTHPQQASSFFVDLYATLALTLTLIIALAVGGGWLVLQYGNMGNDNNEVLFLTLLMAPSLLFICLFGLNNAFLQCEKHYFLPAVAPITFNAIWIIGLLCLQNYPVQQAMTYLCLFIVLASLCQWLMTARPTWHLLSSQYTLSFIRLIKNMRPFSKDVRCLIQPLLLCMLGVGASQINNALDALFARAANLEGPAYLWYAMRLQQLPLALFGIALAGALLPTLSRACKAQDNAKFNYFLTITLQRATALMLPITAGILLLGAPAINLVYGRGDFDTHSIIGTTSCLWAYGLGLIPMTFVLILAPAFYAKDNYALPTIASVSSMALNIALNSHFIFYLHWGATSVALATSISAWLNWLILALALRQNKDYGLRVIPEGCWPFAIATVVASAIVVWTQSQWSTQFMPWELYTAPSSISFSSALSDQLWQFISLAVLFLTSFAAISWKHCRSLLYTQAADSNFEFEAERRQAKTLSH